MATTEDRIANLAEKHLGISDRAALDADIGDLGVNSMDAVNFLKTVNEEFGIEITPQDAINLNTLRDLINHLDG